METFVAVVFRVLGGADADECSSVSSESCGVRWRTLAMKLLIGVGVASHRPGTQATVLVTARCAE